MATMLAVDLGAQSGRIVLGRYDGERLMVSEIHRFPNVPVATRGVLQWDILRLFGDVVEGLRAAGIEARSIDSVGVDSWGIDFALLDRKGRLLQNPVHYRDRRRANAVEAALSIVPAREAAETFLLIPDLMHYWLGGRPVVERTNATTTQCWDLLERLEIPARPF